MEEITYKLSRFEGPLDLLLTLISKNKVDINDIPILLICDQYIEYITLAGDRDMEIASDFLVMASELLYIKSKTLLPKEEKEEDPRNLLTDALLRYKQAKEAAAKLAPMFAVYSGRLVKDTDEISVDRTFVTDQKLSDLTTAIKRVIAYNSALERAANYTFKPMISKPIVPVDIKIVNILRHMSGHQSVSLAELLDDSVSLPDMIAIFLGVLELVKINKLMIDDRENVEILEKGLSISLKINPDYKEIKPVPIKTPDGKGDTV